VSDIYRLEYRYTLKGQQMITGFDYQTDLAWLGSEPDTSEVVDQVDAHLTDRFRHCLSTLGVIDELHARQRVLGADVPKTYTKPLNLVGSSVLGAQELPLELCGVIARKTNAAIKSGHGWCFMPPLLDNAQSNSEGQLTLGGEYEANLQLFAALLNDDINTGVFTVDKLHPVVYSETRRKRGDEPFTFQVTNAVVRRKIHFLRSREAQAV
jgi:hypothetical protein